ncbi:4892_t:CDS:2 [Entrophospora sp. SA101]|nr:4892_t:CDS:2 [Entrophospora sp. SA101]
MATPRDYYNPDLDIKDRIVILRGRKPQEQGVDSVNMFIFAKKNIPKMS